jgi:biofilm PGA synthesis lipoprotein PgaB
MGVNTVYLQAYADPDGDGAADSVYFPNRHLPVRADLFNHVAWEIRTRTPVRRLYAWMPVLAFELPKGNPASTDRVVTQPSRSGHLAMGYPRLSPFSPRAMAVVEEIYTDLSRRATFDGVLFHDDVTLTDYEDASPAALRQYQSWGLPRDLAKIRASDELMGRWTNRKTDALERITLHLAEKVRENQAQLRTARNLYAQVVLNPHAESWYSQSLDDAIRDYDFTAVMAMPYMEKAGDPRAFLGRLVGEVKQKPHGLERVLFELQSTDWRTRTDIPSDELAGQVEELYRLGARHVGYYPDNLHRGTQDPSVLRPVFMAHSSDPVLAQLPARR